jgi:hypothetical protein
MKQIIIKDFFTDISREEWIIIKWIPAYNNDVLVGWINDGYRDPMQAEAAAKNYDIYIDAAWKMQKGGK